MSNAKEMTAYEAKMIEIAERQVDATNANTIALSKLREPPEPLSAVQAFAPLTHLRKGGPPMECFETGYTFNLIGESHERTRVSGVAKFQKKSTGIFVCVEISDDLGLDGGDAHASFTRDFNVREADAIRQAETTVEADLFLRKKFKREWSISCFRNFRRHLMNAMVGRPLDEVSAIAQLASLPASEPVSGAAESAAG